MVGLGLRFAITIWGRSLAHFSNFLPSVGPNCPDYSSFCPLSSSGQEKGCFGVGLVVFCICTYPQKGFVAQAAESRTGVGHSWWWYSGQVRPHLGKMRLIWAIYMKSGRKCSRNGEKIQS